MSLDADLRRIERRAYNESVKDGFMEILLGALLVFIGLMVWSQKGVVFIAIFPMLFCNPLLKWLKKRYTYPRIGYVKLRSDDGKKVGLGILRYVLVVIMFLVALSYLFFKEESIYDSIYRLIPLYMAFILLGGFTYLHSKSENNITYLYIGVTMISGILMTAFHPGPYRTGSLQYLALMGLFFTAAGTVIFIRFIRRHPVAPEENTNGQ
ncbi:MAG TPA: hypothetical protein PK718_08250 [Candidatus Methanofastidiosa archaeon]|nr:hypothetical protein [Candidatus Methanofastidiosa archaeon]HPR42515.1 hypothetical protein [Candidatus Methanofastidiosa archaeon]